MKRDFSLIEYYNPNNHLVNLLLRYQEEDVLLQWNTSGMNFSIINETRFVDRIKIVIVIKTSTASQLFDSRLDDRNFPEKFWNLLKAQK